MSTKYSPDQLRDMATRALAARSAGDDRWLRLVMTLAFHFGCAPRAIEQHIEALAK